MWLADANMCCADVKSALLINYGCRMERKMKIVNLVENTNGNNGCMAEHGLSFYIETEKHILLVDAGPSEVILKNAETLGVDLSKVDTVILTHGHYDHSGGLMAFAGLNPDAAIYMQKSAGADYYADDGEEKGEQRYRYIGIDKALLNLPQVKIIEGDFRIDEELFLFTVKKKAYKLPFANDTLLVKGINGYSKDRFEHEQYLVIEEKGRRVLISGCAHNGIPNILEEYQKTYGAYPDQVISGFHFKKKSEYTDTELLEIINTAKSLNAYHTHFTTCHCTGIPAYSVMKNIMGDKLGYVHSGEKVALVLSKPGILLCSYNDYRL